VVGINWYMAARYCNLLSKEEGVPEEEWCYEIRGPQDMKLKENYLSLSGYRLPTEAEMEYATRAGATTSRYYGESEELLGNYAWYAKNSGDLLQPVGRKKPNDYGLFDAQGNCYTWCQEPYGAYPVAEDRGAVDDREVDKDKLSVVGNMSRVLRGGSFSYLAPNSRSARRVDYVPAFRYYHLGFRPARTLAH
jgi:formylglycine-generating enzyme required for sulfatase activity